MLLDNVRVLKCVICDVEFKTTNNRAVTCSKKCSNKNYRDKQKAKKQSLEIDLPVENKTTTKPLIPIVNEVRELKANDKLLNIKEVCKMLDCSDRFIYDLVKNGLLKCIKLSERKKRFHINDINSYIKSQNK